VAAAGSASSEVSAVSGEVVSTWPAKLAGCAPDHSKPTAVRPSTLSTTLSTSP
jgi:hypothetical protein